VPFSVWDAAAIAVKASVYAATLAAAGAVFFLGYAGDLVGRAERSRIRRLVVSLSILSVLASAAQLMVTAGSMSGNAKGMLDETLVSMVWQAGQWRAITIRAAGLLIAALGMLSDRSRLAAYGGAAMAATSFAWLGHARSLNPDALPVLLLGIHLLSVAFWLGALAPLLIVAHAHDAPRIAAAAARFGRMAVVVVAGLIAAGLGLLWLLLGHVSALWSSTYGRYVMAKLAVVAVLLCFAAYNKLRLTPRLPADDGAARSLQRSIRCEMLLGAAILLVTAAFTTVTGPPALD